MENPGQKESVPESALDRVQELALKLGKTSARNEHLSQGLKETQREIRKLKRELKKRDEKISVLSNDLRRATQRLQGVSRDLQKIRGSVRWRVINTIGNTRRNPTRLPRFPIQMLRAVGGAQKDSLLVRSARGIDRSLTRLYRLPILVPRLMLVQTTYMVKATLYFLGDWPDQ